MQQADLHRACRRGITLFFLASALLACGSDRGHSPQVERTLRAAGENRAELEGAIEHFRKSEDARKLEAVFHLIANMRSHHHEEITLFNSSRQEVRIDYFRYPDLASLRSALEEFERLQGPTHWGLKQRQEDPLRVSGGELIENVEKAFEAWRSRPWAQDLSWTVFKDIVLPYRIGNEPLEPWRREFMARYRPKSAGLSHSDDPIEAAGRINDDLKSWFSFDERLYYRRTDMAPSEMLRTGLGRCEDMAALAAMAMRANALPVSVDYTPFWPNSHGNHVWNVLHAPEGEIPFMGCERRPGNYSFRKLGFRMAKIYRKTFAEQKEALAFQVRGRVTAPSWLAGKHYKDVTDRYMQVAEVEATLTVPPQQRQIAYLSVFNSGQWNPIDWAKIEGKRARFRKMGVGIAYLPSYFEKGRALPAGPPLILRQDGRVEVLRPSQEELAETTLNWVKPPIVHGDGAVQPPGPIKAGKRYLLYRWDDGWVEEAGVTAQGERLGFPGLRSGVLYWLIEDGRGDEERIFTLEDGRPRYW